MRCVAFASIAASRIGTSFSGKERPLGSSRGSARTSQWPFLAGKRRADSACRDGGKGDAPHYGRCAALRAVLRQANRRYFCPIASGLSREAPRTLACRPVSTAHPLSHGDEVALRSEEHT